VCHRSRSSRHPDLGCLETVRLEHVFVHLLLVVERVHRRLREQNLVLFGIDVHLLVESVVPHVLHAHPVLDDAVLHRVRSLQHRAVLRALIADLRRQKEGRKEKQQEGESEGSTRKKNNPRRIGGTSDCHDARRSLDCCRAESARIAARHSAMQLVVQCIRLNQSQFCTVVVAVARDAMAVVVAGGSGSERASQSACRCGRSVRLHARRSSPPLVAPRTLHSFSTHLSSCVSCIDHDVL